MLFSLGELSNLARPFAKQGKNRFNPICTKLQRHTHVPSCEHSHNTLRNDVSAHNTTRNDVAAHNTTRCGSTQACTCRLKGGLTNSTKDTYTAWGITCFWVVKVCGKVYSFKLALSFWDRIPSASVRLQRYPPLGIKNLETAQEKKYNGWRQWEPIMTSLRSCINFCANPTHVCKRRIKSRAGHDDSRLSETEFGCECYDSNVKVAGSNLDEVNFCGLRRWQQKRISCRNNNIFAWPHIRFRSQPSSPASVSRPRTCLATRRPPGSSAPRPSFSLPARAALPCVSGWLPTPAGAPPSALPASDWSRSLFPALRAFPFPADVRKGHFSCCKKKRINEQKRTRISFRNVKCKDNINFI